jgi:hypothetical protein
VDQLDGDPGLDRRAPRCGREEDERRAQPLPAGGERLRRDRGDEPAVAPDGLLEPLLELVEVLLEPGRLTDDG